MSLAFVAEISLRLKVRMSHQGRPMPSCDQDDAH